MRAQTALPVTRIVLGVGGGVLGLLGVLLLADWHWLAERWLWPMPPLPARVIGAWLCT